MNYVEEVIKWFNESSSDIQKEFLETPREKLILFHHTLGRNIRNEFKLWEQSWEPNIINGADHSEDHPDQKSMRIIYEVWDKLTLARN